MQDKDIKNIIKKEIAPLLIGLRNDLDDNKKQFSQDIQNLTEEVKKKSVLEYDLEISESELENALKGKDGIDGNPPTDEKLLNLITPLIPKKGKDYFTNKDIKDLVDSVFLMLPKKDDLKGEDCWTLEVCKEQNDKIYSFDEWCSKFGHKPSFLELKFKTGKWYKVYWKWNKKYY
jgi:hypothetical protein